MTKALGLSNRMMVETWSFFISAVLYSGNLSWADETVGNFGLPDSQGLNRNVNDARENLDLSVTWQNRWVDVAVYGKNLTEDDNYLATGVDVGVFYFGALAPGRSWGSLGKKSVTQILYENTQKNVSLLGGASNQLPASDMSTH